MVRHRVTQCSNKGRCMQDTTHTAQSNNCFTHPNPRRSCYRHTQTHCLFAHTSASLSHPSTPSSLHLPPANARTHPRRPITRTHATSDAHHNHTQSCHTDTPSYVEKSKIDLCKGTAAAACTVLYGRVSSDIARKTHLLASSYPSVVKHRRQGCCAGTTTHKTISTQAQLVRLLSFHANEALHTLR